MSNLGVKEADPLWHGRRMWVSVRLLQPIAGVFKRTIVLGTYRREYDFFNESKKVTGRARLKR